MGFKKINVGEIIAENCKNDKEFKEAWDASKMEYALIGQLIELRKSQSLSQKELAERTKKTQQAISRIEKKEINPSLKIVCQIADSLGYELKLIPKS